MAASVNTQNQQPPPVQAPVRRQAAPIQRPGAAIQQRNVRGGPAGRGVPANQVPTANHVPTFSPSFQGGPTGAARTVGTIAPATPGRLQFAPVSPPAAERGPSAALRTPRPGVVDASPRGAAVSHALAKPAALRFYRAHAQSAAPGSRTSMLHLFSDMMATCFAAAIIGMRMNGSGSMCPSRKTIRPTSIRPFPTVILQPIFADRRFNRSVTVQAQNRGPPSNRLVTLQWSNASKTDIDAIRSGN